LLTASGLIPIDAPVRNALIVERKSIVPGKDVVMLHPTLFQGGIEEFTDPLSYSKYSEYIEHSTESKKRSLFDELDHYL
jgi:hypothetical protein